VTRSSSKTPEQERRALDQRRANEQALAGGRPLPFPNPWDVVEPTKIASGATDAQLQASYAAFR
jgi:hypothetical protein